MKKIFSIMLFLPLFGLAQSGKFISHTVGAKESLSSIGRMYNVNGREIAKYNNINYDKGLSLGQVLKIPVTPNSNNPVKSAEEVKAPVKSAVSKPAETSAAGTPIYHVVAKKETLYHISTLYNKVPIADLKKWNSLPGDAVPEGYNLIVGYSKPAVSDQVTTNPSPAAVKKEVPVVIEKTIVKPSTPAVTNVEIKSTGSTGSAKKGGEGYFKNIYSNSASRSEEKGTAGIFKSTSGWADGRYYCLHNAAVAGSIIKITNVSTQKTIYAKVLDVMPDIKQNKGLALLVSDAAASELGAGTTNFECAVSY